MHPMAIKGNNGGNSGAWNEIKAGDHIICLCSGKTGIVDECLHDGDAFVTWDDGTYSTVKWHNLAPSAKVKVNGSNWEAIR